MTLRAPRFRLLLAIGYAVAMLLVAFAHRPLAVTPIERALILAAYRLPGADAMDFCLPGLGERHRLDTPCDACVLAAAPGLAAVAAADLDAPRVVLVSLLPTDRAAPVAPDRQRPHPRGPPPTA